MDPNIDWIVFAVFVIVMLATDIVISRRHRGKIPMRTAVIQTVICISLAAVFTVWVMYSRGVDPGLDYITAFLTEKSMSMDNLFVFIMIFSMFAIPEEYRHKVLFFGVYGAIIFRAIFIFIGSELLERFEVAVLVFGILLILLAVKSVAKTGEGGAAKWLFKHLKVSEDCADGRFFTVENGKKVMTPLMAAVIAIELTDILFAVDSVPACLGITTDVYIVYASNIFAILGLRSLFFVIDGSVNSLKYMKYGLAGILGFVGVKMVLSDIVHIESFVSLIVIASILIVTIVASKMVSGKSGESSDN